MLRGIWIRAHQQLLVIGDIPVAGPDLLARHQQVISHHLGPALEVGEVGARIGLRKALAPDGLAAQDPG